MTDRPGWLFIIGIIIGMLVVLFVILFVIPWTSTARAQQRDRVTCYDSGNTRICETFDSMGNVTSKSRCYSTGRGETRCETTTSPSVPPILPVPINPPPRQ